MLSKMFFNKLWSWQFWFQEVWNIEIRSQNMQSFQNCKRGILWAFWKYTFLQNIFLKGGFGDIKKIRKKVSQSRKRGTRGLSTNNTVPFAQNNLHQIFIVVALF